MRLRGPLPFVMRDTSSQREWVAQFWLSVRLIQPTLTARCLLDLDRPRQDGRNLMTAPLVGETFFKAFMNRA